MSHQRGPEPSHNELARDYIEANKSSLYLEAMDDLVKSAALDYADYINGGGFSEQVNYLVQRGYTSEQIISTLKRFKANEWHTKAGDEG